MLDLYLLPRYKTPTFFSRFFVDPESAHPHSFSHHMVEFSRYPSCDHSVILYPSQQPRCLLFACFDYLP